MSYSTIDSRFCEIARRAGYLTDEQIGEVRRSKSGSEVGLYIGRLMVQNRLITARQFLEIYLLAGGKVVECRNCGARFGKSEVDTGRCPQCRAHVVLRGPEGTLSEIEILSSLDPSDLKVLTSGVEPLEGTTPPPASGVHGEDAAPFFQRFEVRGELGRGGMGVVLLAFDKSLLREVAIKVIHPGRLNEGDTIDRFTREANVLARLDHPGIVRAYTFTTYKGFFYLVMERIRGRSLALALETGDPLPIERCRDIMEKLLDAVGHAHARDVLHRDLKPTNILLDEAGNPHIIDFGLAKDLVAGTGWTQAGTRVGTPYYMSPEQSFGTETVDGRADIYSLSAILYEMLTAKRPYSAESRTQLYVQIQQVMPPPPSHVNPDVPASIDKACMKGLAKHPDDRFQTCEEFCLALGSSSRPGADRTLERTVKIEAFGKPKPPLHPAPHATPVPPVVLILIGCVIGAGAFGLLWLLLSRG